MARDNWVHVQSDNTAMVEAINKQSSRSDTLLSVIQPLVLLSLKFNFTVAHSNMFMCDILSRLQLTEFQLHAPHGVRQSANAHSRPAVHAIEAETVRLIHQSFAPNSRKAYMRGRQLLHSSASNTAFRLT